MTLIMESWQDYSHLESVGQILDFFLDHKEFDYSANEIAQRQGCRLGQSLERCQVLKKTNSYITVGKLAKQICID